MSGIIESEVGSGKSFKIEAVSLFLARHFHTNERKVVGSATESGVPEQPRNKQSTIEGAANRSKKVLDKNEGASFGFGLEGGIFRADNGNTYVFDVAAITVNTSTRRTFIGESKPCLLPPELVAYLDEDPKLTLSKAMQRFLWEYSHYQEPEEEIMKNGAAYYLSGGKQSRDLNTQVALENAMKQVDNFLGARRRIIIFNRWSVSFDKNGIHIDRKAA